MGGGVKFGRDALVEAFNQIGSAAIENGTHLEIAVYGGSALMLASKFRFATEDVDIAELKEYPKWFIDIASFIAEKNGWEEDWINDSVQFHLSKLADRSSDHVEFSSFPLGGDQKGLTVFVPNLEYMLALKLKSMRINEPGKGEQEVEDIQNLIVAGGIKDIDEAIEILGKYFPKSAQSPEKQKFFLRHIWPGEGVKNESPEYPSRSI